MRPSSCVTAETVLLRGDAMTMSDSDQTTQAAQASQAARVSETPQAGEPARSPRPNAVLAAVLDSKLASPDAPAFRAHGCRATTYGELWDTSTRIAGELAARTSDRAPIVVIGPKSAMTVATFLACLRSGHAFVPMDVSMPATRIRDVVDQIEAGEGGRALAIPTTSPDDPDVADVIPQGCLYALDLIADSYRRRGRTERDDVAGHPAPVATLYEPSERDRWVRGEETQYIIFTSGSTGRPKGIEVTANDVANFACWMHMFPVVADRRRTFLDQAPYSFDLSEYGLVGALTTGGCLYAIDAHAKDDARLLYEELAESQVDVWVSTPSFATLCLADPTFDRNLMPHVSLFLFCGETLGHRTASMLVKRFPHARVANTYGPTESTVAVTYCEVTPEMLASDDALPVGRPRPGTQLRIMGTDAEGGLADELPRGETGEIVIVGDTVAKDYYHNPAKTEAAFFPATFSDGRPTRAYRTGDLGYLDEGGMLHYLGRNDSLVKMNGFRIELGDVENNLASLAGVGQAAIVPVRRNGEVTNLRGFVVLDHDEPTEDETPRRLRERLGELVPAYMLPRRIAVLPEMPLTANGKIDRKALVAM